MKIGQKVSLVKGSKSYRHFQFAQMFVSGKIITINSTHYEGRHLRPYEVQFTDGRTGWYAIDELVKI